MTSLPSLFLSHGSPMTALDPGAAGAFFTRLGPAIDATFGRPRAIVVFSAHTLTQAPARPPEGRAPEREARRFSVAPLVLGGARHEAIHDFGGFDAKLYTLRYDAPGAPELAARVAALLPAQSTDAGGLDHGIWTPLRYVYPAADVPLLPVGWNPRTAPSDLMALGAKLAPLADEGVLVVGSGSITHNLRRVAQAGFHTQSTPPEIAESAAFRRWFAERAAARDWDALADYRGQAPHATDMHPSDEHLLPWYLAAGAGGRDASALRLHDSVTHGSLGMDAYAFGAGASALADALR